MPTYLRIGMVCLGLLASSCSTTPPRPVSMPPQSTPWRICTPDEDPSQTGCKRDQPSAAITTRGYHE